jgi:hypothetical protein
VGYSRKNNFGSLSLDSACIMGKPEVIGLAEKSFYKHRMGWLM